VQATTSGWGVAAGLFAATYLLQLKSFAPLGRSRLARGAVVRSAQQAQQARPFTARDLWADVGPQLALHGSALTLATVVAALGKGATDASLLQRRDDGSAKPPHRAGN